MKQIQLREELSSFIVHFHISSLGIILEMAFRSFHVKIHRVSFIKLEFLIER